MDDIRHVRKRIQGRRYEETADNKKAHPVFRLFYHFIMLMMGVCMFVLAFLVNQKLEIIEMPAALQDVKIENISTWLPFEKWFSLKDESVSANVSYSLLKNNEYSNGSNVAYNAYDAIVLHVQKNNEGKTSLTLKQDNGIITTYGNLEDVSLKQDERILKGRPLGTYQSYVTIDFLEKNKRVDLTRAMHE